MKKLTSIVGVALLTSFGMAHIQAAEITIAAGLLPPHVNVDGSGREAEIIEATLEKCGHTVSYQVEPFTRHWKSFKRSDSIDAVTTVPEGFPMPGHRSVNYIKYHNGITTLASSNMNVNSLDDLAGKRVVAFADAKYIVPGLSDAIPTFKSYKEQTDQLIQSNLLFSGRIDAIVGDGLIFSAFNNYLVEKGENEKLRFDPSQDVDFKAIFEPSAYALVFRDSALQQDFDRCYSDLMASGVLDEINQKYVDEHSKVVTSEYIGL